MPTLGRKAAMAEAVFIVSVGWDRVRMMVMHLLRPVEDPEF